MKLVLSAAFIFLAVLQGCAGTEEVRATNALAIACDSYGDVLKQVNKKLADKTLSIKVGERVQGVNEMVKPACGKDSKLNPAEAVGVAKAGLASLNKILGVQ